MILSDFLACSSSTPYKDFSNLFLSSCSLGFLFIFFKPASDVDSLWVIIKLGIKYETIFSRYYVTWYCVTMLASFSGLSSLCIKSEFFHVALSFRPIQEPSSYALNTLSCGFSLSHTGPLLMAPLVPSPQPHYTYNRLFATFSTAAFLRLWEGSCVTGTLQFSP